MRVCLFPNEIRDTGLSLTREICAYLKQQGSLVFMPFCENMPEGVETLTPQMSKESFDFALSLGGDGTVLRVAQDLSPRTPLLGINLGHLGYLNEVECNNWRPALDRLLKGQYLTENRMRLSAELEFTDENGAVTERHGFKALNDVVLRRADTSGAILFDIAINGTAIETMKADGVIFSTPTGSTAYNLAALGPVLNPVARGFVLTPLCCHSMMSRPLVLDPSDTITVTFNPVSYQEAPLLSVDGYKHIRLDHKTSLYVTGAPSADDCRMARVTDKNFYAILKNKMEK